MLGSISRTTVGDHSGRARRSGGLEWDEVGWVAGRCLAVLDGFASWPGALSGASRRICHQGVGSDSVNADRLDLCRAPHRHCQTMKLIMSTASQEGYQEGEGPRRDRLLKMGGCCMGKERGRVSSRNNIIDLPD
jgi:hypothetical protein